MRTVWLPNHAARSITCDMYSPILLACNSLCASRAAWPCLQGSQMHAWQVAQGMREAPCCTPQEHGCK